jgi:hypothetical protein
LPPLQTLLAVDFRLRDSSLGFLQRHPLVYKIPIQIINVGVVIVGRVKIGHILRFFKRVVCPEVVFFPVDVKIEFLMDG